MILHLVLFRLRPGVSRDDARFKAVVQAMHGLPSQISLIRGWEHGVNLTPDAEAWDYGLCAMFDSEADLHAYFEHPAHLPVVEQWNAIATLAFVDFGHQLENQTANPTTHGRSLATPVNGTVTVPAISCSTLRKED